MDRDCTVRFCPVERKTILDECRQYEETEWASTSVIMCLYHSMSRPHAIPHVRKVPPHAINGKSSTWS